MFLVPVPWTSLFLHWITLKFTSLFLIFSIPLYVLGFQTVGQIHRVLDVRRFLSWWDSYSLPMIVAEFFKSDTSPLYVVTFLFVLYWFCDATTDGHLLKHLEHPWSIVSSTWHRFNGACSVLAASFRFIFEISFKALQYFNHFFQLFVLAALFSLSFGWPISLRNSCNQSGPRLWWFLDYSFPR